MQFYWILTSHIFALLPIGQCLWSFKQYRTYDSLLTMLHLIFTVYFSICYHTNDYDDIDTPLNSQYIWKILDHWSSSVCIVENVIYTFKVKEPIIYIVSYTSGTVLLFLEVANQNLAVHFYIFLSILFTLIIKYKNTLKYLKQWYLRSIMTVLCGGLAIYSIYAPSLGMSYEVWHPIWHTCIFTTAFLGNSMRHSLDEQLFVMQEYTRTVSHSI